MRDIFETAAGRGLRAQDQAIRIPLSRHRSNGYNQARDDDEGFRDYERLQNRFRVQNRLLVAMSLEEVICEA